MSSVIVRKGGRPQTATYSQVPDIPIEKYTVTAKHVPTGKSLKLRKSYQGDYAASMVAEFEPEFNFYNRCLTIQFSDK